MPARAGSRRTLIARLVAAIVGAALCGLLGRGLLAGAAGAQTGTTTATTADGAGAEATTTTVAVTTTTVATVASTTIPEQADTTEAVDDTGAESGSRFGVDEAEPSTTTTALEEEVEASTTTLHASTTTTLHASTTVPPATTKVPAPSAATTSAAVPSSAASSNGAATSGSGTTQPTDDSQQRLRLVMATLVVIGLIFGLLTWRYWRYSDPKRGLAPSRARLPVAHPQPSVEALEPTMSGPAGEPTALAGSAMAETAMLVPFGAGQAELDQTLQAGEDPTDPGGWVLPDREPVGSD